MRQNKTYEASARIERELIPNVALSGGWVYHQISNLYFNTQINRPYDQWVPATPATPFLDQNYTIFGEVVSGMNTVDQIAAQPTSKGDDQDRPLQDVRILSTRLIKRKNYPVVN